jgi:transposase
MRQIIEQDFDISKIYDGITPLRAHSEDTLRGYLLISFLATSNYSLLTCDLKSSIYSACTDIKAMNTSVIHVYSHLNFFENFTKKQKEIFNHLKLEFPHKFGNMNFLQKLSFINSDDMKKRGCPSGSSNKVKRCCSS